MNSQFPLMDSIAAFHTLVHEKTGSSYVPIDIVRLDIYGPAIGMKPLISFQYIVFAAKIQILDVHGYRSARKSFKRSIYRLLFCSGIQLFLEI